MIGDDNTVIHQQVDDDIVNRKVDSKSKSVEDLEVEFAIKANKIKQALCNSSIDVKSVIEQLQTISAVKDKEVPLVDEDVFKNVTTVEKLWEKLNSFWSLFNYDILIFLVRFSQCKRAQEILEEFLSNIDVSAMEDVDLLLHHEVFKRKGLMKPLLRVKVRAEKCTDFVERTVKEILSSKFNLEKYSLHFRGIKEGCNCIELVYEISNMMMLYFLQCKFTGYDLAHFAAYDIIISLHINDMELKVPSEIDMVCTNHIVEILR